jgi:DNA-binding PadR family transcriptional regulator
MPGLSNAETALLGLLSEEPMHPYRIEQEVKYRDMRSWTGLSMSSIYKLLRKLEKDGMVLGKNVVSSENRLRKSCEISEKGTAALRKKIESLLSVVEHVSWPIDIGIYNCDLIPRKKACAALNRYRDILSKKAADYKKLLQFLRDSGCPPHRFGVATRPVFMLEAEMRWVDDYLLNLNRTKTKTG